MTTTSHAVICAKKKANVIDIGIVGVPFIDSVSFFGAGASLSLRMEDFFRIVGTASLLSIFALTNWKRFVSYLKRLIQNFYFIREVVQ